MKKNFFALSLVSSMSLIALASCGTVTDVTKKDGVLLTIDGNDITVKEVFDKIDGSVDSAKTYYDAVNEILIRSIEDRTEDITIIVDSKMDTFKQKAKDNAGTNKTTYEEELEKLLAELSFDTLDQLREDYYFQEQKRTNEDAFYSKDSYAELTKEYVEETAPYHMKHILVKVDAVSTSIWDGKISENDSLQISNVIHRLGQGNETFGQIAKTASEDTGSAEAFGDVGIMSKKTGFVPEFKLNVYAYESFFGKTDASKETVKKTLGVPTDTNTSGILGTTIRGIPYSTADELFNYKDKVKSTANKVVKDATENNYPRNIIFNNYYNNHGLNMIYLDEGTEPTTPIKDSRFVKLSEITGKSIDLTVGASEITTVSDPKVLVDEKGNPILVSRAGTGSGDSGYEGIHFMVIERSPFVAMTKTVEGKEINRIVDYYNLTIPSTTKPEENKADPTFISFIKADDRTVYDKRADTIKTALKGMDTNMALRMYEKNVAKATTKNIVINETVAAKIQNYIKMTRDSADYSSDKAFNLEWTKFVDKLLIHAENSSRSVKETCITEFLSGTLTEECTKNV